ncbi:unnamed protein product [Amoebophrya sp. A120]|nr:unnamed protein product [Amoebophrya sp. A120]|eukprot:GSA120T00000201001.1
MSGHEFEAFVQTAAAMAGDDVDPNWLKELWEGADGNANRAINHLLDTPESKFRRVNSKTSSGGGKSPSSSSAKKEKKHKSPKSGSSPNGVDQQAFYGGPTSNANPQASMGMAGAGAGGSAGFNMGYPPPTGAVPDMSQFMSPGMYAYSTSNMMPYGGSFGAVVPPHSYYGLPPHPMMSTSMGATAGGQQAAPQDLPPAGMLGVQNSRGEYVFDPKTHASQYDMTSPIGKAALTNGQNGGAGNNANGGNNLQARKELTGQDHASATKSSATPNLTPSLPFEAMQEKQTNLQTQMLLQQQMLANMRNILLLQQFKDRRRLKTTDKPEWWEELDRESVEKNPFAIRPLEASAQQVKDVASVLRRVVEEQENQNTHQKGNNKQITSATTSKSVRGGGGAASTTANKKQIVLQQQQINAMTSPASTAKRSKAAYSSRMSSKGTNSSSIYSGGQQPHGSAAALAKMVVNNQQQNSNRVVGVSTSSPKPSSPKPSSRTATPLLEKRAARMMKELGCTMGEQQQTRSSQPVVLDKVQSLLDKTITLGPVQEEVEMVENGMETRSMKKSNYTDANNNNNLLTTPDTAVPPTSSTLGGAGPTTSANTTATQITVTQQTPGLKAFLSSLDEAMQTYSTELMRAERNIAREVVVGNGSSSSLLQTVEPRAGAGAEQAALDHQYLQNTSNLSSNLDLLELQSSQFSSAQNSGAGTGSGAGVAAPGAIVMNAAEANVLEEDEEQEELQEQLQQKDAMYDAAWTNFCYGGNPAEEGNASPSSQSNTISFVINVDCGGGANGTTSGGNLNSPTVSVVPGPAAQQQPKVEQEKEKQPASTSPWQTSSRFMQPMDDFLTLLVPKTEVARKLDGPGLALIMSDATEKQRQMNSMQKPEPQLVYANANGAGPANTVYGGPTLLEQTALDLAQAQQAGLHQPFLLHQPPQVGLPSVKPQLMLAEPAGMMMQGPQQGATVSSPALYYGTNNLVQEPVDQQLAQQPQQVLLQPQQQPLVFQDSRGVRYGPAAALPAGGLAPGQPLAFVPAGGGGPQQFLTPAAAAPAGLATSSPEQLLTLSAPVQLQQQPNINYMSAAGAGTQPVLGSTSGQPEQQMVSVQSPVAAPAAFGMQQPAVLSPVLMDPGNLQWTMLQA